MAPSDEAAGLSLAAAAHREARDLGALADKVRSPALQERLLHELRRLAEANQQVEADELSTIKFFATRWGCAPPPIPGVVWESVELPGGD